ncbi:MAG TPA: ABC transporter substrate-binding protein [Burkholderiaceae bacterium]|nr:ABC transporter substrate-binding protein [Burkholderiaceae bacterium]
MMTLKKWPALCATLLLALAAGSAQAQKRTLVLSAYGLNQEFFQKHIYAPFKAQCNCEIVVETGNAADRLAKLEARRANQNIDLIQLTDFTALEASAKDLLIPLDYGKIKNAAQIYDFAKDPLRNQQAIGYTVYSVGLVVRTDKPSNTITSWKDLWRPDLKGHLLLPNITTNQGIYLLFMGDRAWGGLSTDYTTAMGKLSEIKGNVVTFYTQTAQMTSLFAQDEAWVAPVGRFSWLNLQKTGKPLKWVVPKEGQAGAMNVLAIPKGSKNADLALQLIDFWLAKETQAALANDLVDSPINPQAKVLPEKAAMLTFGKEQINSLVFLKPETVLRERTGWVNAWNRQVAR